MNIPHLKARQTSPHCKSDDDARKGVKLRAGLGRVLFYTGGGVLFYAM